MSRWLSFLQPRRWKDWAKAVVGEVSYKPPLWAGKIWSGAKRHPRRCLAGAAILLMLGIAGWKTWSWWEAHRPRARQFTEERQITAKLSPPGVTPIVKNKPQPQTLRLDFSAAAAKLDLVGKTVAEGVKLTPAHPGEWKWPTDKSLVFTPSEDWPAGREFRVELNRTLLAAEAKLKENEWTFTTAALAPKIENLSFYTNPQDPDQHQVVATLRFTHPVDLKDVRNRVRIEVMGQSPIFNWGGKPPSELFTVTEGKLQREFFFRTARIVAPAKEDFVRLTVAPGLSSTLGGAATKEAVADKVRVPDMDSGFSIDGVTAEIVRTEEGEPQQFIFIDTDGYASPQEVAAHVEAMLLPKDKPKIGREAAVEGYEWSKPGEVTAEILKLSQPVKLSLVEVEKGTDAPVSTRHGFKMLVERPGYLQVKVQTGLKALGGFRLAKEHAAIIAAPEFPKEVEILGEGGLLALNGERKVSIKSRGAHHLRITLGRVPSTQVNHLARFGHGAFQEPEFYGSIDEQNIGHFHREVRPVPARNDYEAVYTTFDFSDALAREDKSDSDQSRGMFFVTVEGVEPRANDEDEATEAEEGADDSKDPDPAISKWQSIGEPGEERGATTARRFILITDLGLVVKRSADGSRDVFVQSVGRGDPLPGVMVTVLSKNGEFLAQSQTDAEGHVKLPPVEHLQREKTPAAITARSGNDLAFIPFARDDRMLDFSRFDTGGVLASEKDRLDAFVFTERGVYRPGDTVHIAGIVRRRDWSGNLDGLPLKITIRDPRDGELTDSFPLPEDGFFEWDAETDEADPTGQYEIVLSLVKGPQKVERIGRAAFRVEDFQPDRMKMNVALTAPTGLAWLQPHDVKADVSLETLFGFAAAKRKVKAKMELSPASFAFDQFPDFVFHNRSPLKLERNNDSDDEAIAGKTVELGETETDDAGKAQIDLGLNRFGEGSFRLNLTVEAFEADGGRSVQAGKSVLVAPMPYVIGYKADGPLGYIGKDTQRNLRLMCLGPDLKPRAAPALSARIVSIRHVSVLTKQDNGSYAYVSTRRETTASEAPFALPTEGAVHSLPTQAAGEFRFELRDNEARVVCAADFAVVGKGDPGRSLERDAELELKLARTNWSSGEPLEFNLTAPYTGSGLITIERENVLAWKWFRSPTPSSTLAIPVPGGFDGTGYVNVAFVRALDSPEVFISPLSYAVQPFVANPDHHRMAVKVDCPELVKPGEVLKIGYTSEQAGRVAIFAVDEGILQVTNYKLPQPLSHFLRKRALEIETHQLLDLILPEFSLLSTKAFGGDEEEKLKVNLNPFKRRKEAPAVFWSGLVECGPGRREVSYEVPDYFTGKLRVMAVALAADKIGASETSSTVRGPFVLTPNAPTVTAPGDEFTMSLTVANNLEGASATSAIAITASATEQLEMLDDSESQLKVEPGREGTARIRFRARDMLGGAEIALKASAAGQEMKRSVTLSVRPAAPYLTEVKSGYFRMAKQDVKLDRTVYPNFRKAEAAVSALPLGLAGGLEGYLHEYPHGCSEQITSRAMARLLLANEIDFGFNRAESAEQIDSALQQLQLRQNSNGGFAYWAGESGDSSAMDFLSVYVMYFLIEAKEANQTLPDGLLEGAVNRLKQLARGKTENAEAADIQAAAIYLLTRNGEVTTNFALALRDTLEQQRKNSWQSSLAAACLAGTYALLKKHPEGEALMRTWWSKTDKTPRLESWRHDYFADPKVKQAQGFAVLCREFPAIAASLGYDDLKMIIEPIQASRFNTISAAYGILALKAYSKLVQQSNVKLSISALAPQGEPQLLLPDGTGLRKTTFAPGIGGLRFHLDQAGTDLGAFYQVLESGFDKGGADAVIADGLEVSRDILNKDGKPVSKLAVGEGATVRIRVRNNSPDALQNVAVLDLMPGGFELEPNSLRPGRAALPGADYVDVREDRSVVYLGLGKGESRVFSYRIKPVCAGRFVVPPIFAECMYDRGTKGRAGGGIVEVQ